MQAWGQGGQLDRYDRMGPTSKYVFKWKKLGAKYGEYDVGLGGGELDKYGQLQKGQLLGER